MATHPQPSGATAARAIAALYLTVQAGCLAAFLVIYAHPLVAALALVAIVVLLHGAAVGLAIKWAIRGRAQVLDSRVRRGS